MSPTGPDEQILVDQFSKELMDYYQPKNPLAILQIERIAICRAKLVRLYEVEKVRLQLAYRALEYQPDKVVEKLVHINGVPKGILMELVKHGITALPCGLEPKLLKQICMELELFYGKIDNDNHLQKYFPILTKYLRSQVVRGLSEDASLIEILCAIIKKIEAVFKDGDRYFQLFLPLLEKIVELQNPSPIEEPLDPELQEYIEQSKLKYSKNKNSSTPDLPEEVEDEVVAPEENTSIKSGVLLKKMNVFPKLLNAYEQAVSALEQYEQVKKWLQQSVTLVPSEADLLLRYQTTLERRLSGSMGELLALQKQGLL
jgi:hypothetical protein